MVQESMETLLKSEIVPDFVVINSFNEYAEHTAVFSADTSDFLTITLLRNG